MITQNPGLDLTGSRYRRIIRPVVRKTITRITRVLLVNLLAILALSYSNMAPAGPDELVRAYTRRFEFDYVSWIAEALLSKLDQAAVATNRYLTDTERHQAALDYLKLVDEIQRAKARLTDIYSDPAITDPASASTALRQQIKVMTARQYDLAPLAAEILQNQVSQVVADFGLTVGGQPLPPVLYQTTPLPLALIISPRNTIRQDNDISLLPDLTVDQQIELENQVDLAMNVSSLVVPVGGIGVYPTMVMETTDLNWLAEVISHEWTHNYLTLRPLGLNYETSPELRTINETVATISGKEIGSVVIKRYYPELAPPPPPPPTPALPPTAPPSTAPAPSPTPTPPIFDFRLEMHTTRLTVDGLLAQGKIDEAEAYMEARRRVFWDNGYHIRKLNQAYFAFYGAYADQPGGAAGEDPIGAAVRALRARSASLADFLQRVSWISSYQELQKLLANP
jgi:hypothetical protein